MITPLTKTIDNWTISVRDIGFGGRNQLNPNKYNYQANDRTCKIIGCNNRFYITRTSGLCNNHLNHQHDLLLELTNPNGQLINVPAHKEIIDALIGSVN
ncbi:hypothetical protein HZY62_19525 [Maribacter polysiphoniae]|uniref:Uncharacterized protein n=1 Tax=Maribacter polysiphoniae TaxID=429344 RepID=A0A316DSE8_9FLAO|nr:hypothetical protein [Maribacter polysiphoniae]MBD1262797.1 hypothetical protein [Maribacter polysiphoniae]PWK20109.1 hypothetical protein LX92_04052 [Maribacter polysiphoniae]